MLTETELFLLEKEYSKLLEPGEYYFYSTADLRKHIVDNFRGLCPECGVNCVLPMCVPVGETVKCKNGHDVLVWKHYASRVREL